MNPNPNVNTFSAIFPFGGIGGGALGFQEAQASFRGLHGAFTILGGFDNWAYACGVFEYLTGVEEAQVDARTMTGADLIRLFGTEPPHTVFTSPPCVAATKLVTNKKAQEPAYVAMNWLLMSNTRTMFDAWPTGPTVVLVENVENILTAARGADMIREWCAFMRARRYKIHVGTHNARHLGDLGQNRVRLLIIARHEDRMPVFIYKPPHKAGKVLGDIIGDQPLPDDPAGGPMHRMTAGMSFRNRCRLWKIKRGKDWRSLIDDGVPEHERFRRHLVCDPALPCVTISGAGSNGACAVVDERVDALQTAIDLGLRRARFKGSLGVLDMCEPATAVTGEAAPSNGRNAVASPVPVELGMDNDRARHHVNRVTSMDAAVGCVTASPAPSSGAASVADDRIPVDLTLKMPARPFTNLYNVVGEDQSTPSVTCATRSGGGSLCAADSRVPISLGMTSSESRHRHVLGVQDPGQPSCCVTGEGKVTSGAFAAAAPAPIDLTLGAENPGRHENKFWVVPWGKSVKTICAVDSRVGSGAPVCADPRVPPAHPVDLSTAASTFHEGAGPGRWGVLSPGEASMCVTANARHSTGPFSVADGRPVPVELQLPVTSGPGGGGPGRWGVLDESAHTGCVTANARHCTGPYAVADSRPIPVALMPARPCYDRGYCVLGPKDVSPTVAGKAWVGCGAYATTSMVPPVQLALTCQPHNGAYGVADHRRASSTVIAHMKFDNSPCAVADPREVPRYIVLSYEQTKAIVDGYIPIPFAIVDPADPSTPLAIVDDLDKPAYRLEQRRGKKGKLGKPRRVPVAIWMISEDGTCHRELTTAELCWLQSFPVKHRGKPLDFGGSTTHQRKGNGNAVPPKVAKAIGEQILISAVASTMTSFILTPSDWDIWVQSLVAEGFTVVPTDRPFDFARGVVLDDGALLPGKAAPGKSKSKRPRASKVQTVLASILGLEAEQAPPASDPQG